MNVIERESRVIDTRHGREISWGALLGGLAENQAVFVGEKHDDPNTHRAELAIWSGLASRWKGSAALAMEMFERDQQSALDAYLAGRLDGEGLAKAVKLWNNFPTDYRPMVDVAKSLGLPVIGSNAPAALVRKVGREGLSSISDGEKSLLGWPVLAPEGDAYAKRFAEVMTGGAAHGMAMSEAQLGRTYQAQCLRDATMADAISRAIETGKRVMHVNGSFHSDGGLGTVSRLRWLRPFAKIAVVKCVPVADVRRADPKPLQGEADYLVFVVGKPD